MANNFNDIELLFVEETLDQHGEHIIDLLAGEIASKNLKVTGELLDSIQYKLEKEGADPKLVISFLSYGRAIEINYHKKQVAKKWGTNTNRDVWGIKENRPNKRKDTRWYSRVVYGTLNRLIGILGNEYSDEEIKRLKGILDARKLRLT